MTDETIRPVAADPERPGQEPLTGLLSELSGGLARVWAPFVVIGV